jgi:pimeloyl-ACP methyl ester carboxylesterase
MPSKGLLVFVHGYQDNSTLWRGLLDRLGDCGWESVAVDLRAADTGREDRGAALEEYRDQVLEAVAGRDPGLPVVAVGHSMGAQIAELAALRLERLSGLVLITPAPLGGYPMSQEQFEAFKQRAGSKDRAAIARGKLALSVEPDAAALEALVDATVSVPVATALQQLAAWTAGHPAGDGPSQVEVPTLLVTSDDTFFTADYLAANVAPRFKNVRTARVPGAGHWPHVEAPARLADVLTSFLATLA